jgi:uroporphyrinogen III methyltransferase / synthase
VVKLRAKLNWYENQPLFGRRIVVTQPREQAGPLVHMLGAAGAEVLEIPAFTFAPPTDPQPLQRAASCAGDYNWILFSHPVSVTAFFDQFFQIHQDWRDLGGVRLGAYGSQTAAKLQELHLRVDAIPTEHQGPQLAEALTKHGNLRGRKLLLLRPEGTNPDVPKHLQSLGALVEDVAGYRMLAETEDMTEAAARLVAEGADWITFAGYPEVKFFNGRFDLRALVQRHPQMKWATIGPKTSQQLAALGLKISAEAATPAMEALVAALENRAK